jgi:Transcriptional regulator
LDRRTKKTQNAIKQAFLELLQQKPINKITISEITDKVDIGRGTFYIHYTDIFDLQNKIIAETISDLENIFDLNYPTVMRKIFMKLLFVL